jgi:hypothetical protein
MYVQILLFIISYIYVDVFTCRLEKEMSTHRRHMIKQQLVSPMASCSFSDIGLSLDNIRSPARNHFHQQVDLQTKSVPTRKANGIIHTPLFHGATAIPSTEALEALHANDADILREMIERALIALNSTHPSNHAESRSPQKSKSIGGGARHKSDVFLFVKKKGDFQALLEKMVNTPEPDITETEVRIRSYIIHMRPWTQDLINIYLICCILNTRCV